MRCLARRFFFGGGGFSFLSFASPPGTSARGLRGDEGRSFSGTSARGLRGDVGLPSPSFIGPSFVSPSFVGLSVEVFSISFVGPSFVGSFIEDFSAGGGTGIGGGTKDGSFFRERLGDAANVS